MSTLLILTNLNSFLDMLGPNKRNQEGTIQESTEANGDPCDEKAMWHQTENPRNENTAQPRGHMTAGTIILLKPALKSSGYSLNCRPDAK